MKKTRVTIWNENVEERFQNEFGEAVRRSYPDGIHAVLKENLAADDLDIYKQPEVVRILGNAIRWAAPALPPQNTKNRGPDPALEKVCSQGA